MPSPTRRIGQCRSPGETLFLGPLRVRDSITAVLVYYVGSNTNHKGFPMKTKSWQILSGVCAIVIAGAWSAPACAQAAGSAAI